MLNGRNFTLQREKGVLIFVARAYGKLDVPLVVQFAIRFQYKRREKVQRPEPQGWRTLLRGGMLTNASYNLLRLGGSSFTPTSLWSFVTIFGVNDTRCFCPRWLQSLIKYLPDIRDEHELHLIA